MHPLETVLDQGKSDVHFQTWLWLRILPHQNCSPSNRIQQIFTTLLCAEHSAEGELSQTALTPSSCPPPPR